jgi:hypothetical protein
MHKIRLIVQGETVLKGIYLESRQVRTNWVLLALMGALWLRWFTIEIKGLPKALWLHLFSHILFFFTRQFAQGARSNKRTDFVPVPDDWRPGVPAESDAPVSSSSHRSSESSGGWKIITNQFTRGVHSDAQVFEEVA